MKVHNFGMAIFPLMCNYDIAHLGFYGWIPLFFSAINTDTHKAHDGQLSPLAAAFSLQVIFIQI